MSDNFNIRPIGYVRSPYKTIDDAPRQGRSKGGLCEIELLPEFVMLAEGLETRKRLIVITWMDRADRGLIRMIPCGMGASEPTGIFNTRTPNRPNPIGVCNVELVGISGNVITVRGLDSIDGTPVVDIKPFIEELDC
jgi:tRNA-Thr(GGU) m(6)t(6)A37 methyltransferase TsaA